MDFNGLLDGPPDFSDKLCLMCRPSKILLTVCNYFRFAGDSLSVSVKYYDVSLRCGKEFHGSGFLFTQTALTAFAAF